MFRRAGWMPFVKKDNSCIMTDQAGISGSALVKDCALGSCWTF